jgi:hypothetical protein
MGAREVFLIFKEVKKTLSFSLLLLLCTSCVKKSVPEQQVKGLDYFPLTNGRFVVYEVDSTAYGEIPRDTTVTRYLLKEKLADAFTDNEGREAIRLERYIKPYTPGKPYDSIAWRMRDVWMVNADRKSVLQLEGNVRYTKLVFPVEEQGRWNGNAYNNKGEQEYVYEYADRTETVNGVAIERVVKVKQEEFRTLISYEYQAEKYGAGIGLVQREITAIYSNSIVPGQPVEKRIEKGFVYRQTLLTYGTE